MKNVGHGVSMYVFLAVWQWHILSIPIKMKNVGHGVSVKSRKFKNHFNPKRNYLKKYFRSDQKRKPMMDNLN